MSFSVGQLQFIDSMQFAMGSLDKLVKTLDDDDLKYTAAEFSNDQLNLAKKKGVFPYDHLDSLQRLEETQLPTRRHFANKLSDTRCRLADYWRAKQVWRVFKCETFRDYHDVYLKTDVLLLADFFEKFRQTCLENYGLDAVHYFSGKNFIYLLD